MFSCVRSSVSVWEKVETCRVSWCDLEDSASWCLRCCSRRAIWYCISSSLVRNNEWNCSSRSSYWSMKDLNFCRNLQRVSGGFCVGSATYSSSSSTSAGFCGSGRSCAAIQSSTSFNRYSSLSCSSCRAVDSLFSILCSSSFSFLFSLAKSRDSLSSLSFIVVTLLSSERCASFSFCSWSPRFFAFWCSRSVRFMSESSSV